MVLRKDCFFFFFYWQSEVASWISERQSEEDQTTIYVISELSQLQDKCLFIINLLHHLISLLFLLWQIVNYAYKNNMASVYPEPQDKEAFVLSHIYSPDYDSFTLDTYSWPEAAMNVQDVWSVSKLSTPSHTGSVPLVRGFSFIHAIKRWSKKTTHLKPLICSVSAYC